MDRWRYGGERSDCFTPTSTVDCSTKFHWRAVFVGELAGHTGFAWQSPPIPTACSMDWATTPRTRFRWMVSPSPISKAKFSPTRFRSIRLSRWRSSPARRPLNTATKRALVIVAPLALARAHDAAWQRHDFLRHVWNFRCGLQPGLRGRRSGEILSLPTGPIRGRFLDPPEFVVIHDKGNEENIFDRVDSPAFLCGLDRI